MAHDQLDLPPDPDAGLFGESTSVEDAELVILGVPWEPTVSYGRGTSRAPDLVVKASHQLDFYDPFFDGEVAAQVAMPPCDPLWVEWNGSAVEAADRVIAAGGRVAGSLVDDLTRVNDFSQRLNDGVRAAAAGLLRAGKAVGLVGGDHSAPFGAIAAHAEVFAGMGILHFDAHHDLRVAYEGFRDSHASIMYNVLDRLEGIEALVSVGIRDFSSQEKEWAAKHPLIHTFYQRDMDRLMLGGESFAKVCNLALAALPQRVYVSLDIDGLDPAFCPHTGTPVPGGLSYGQVIFMLEEVLRSGRQIVGFDLVEVAPNPRNGEDEYDANVAARLLHKLCALVLAGRREPSGL